MALATVCTLAIPALADVTGIAVTPGTSIPVGVYAVYTPTTNADPPPIGSFSWSWAGTNCDWTDAGTNPSWGVYENLVGSFTVRCKATYVGLPPPSPSSKTKSISVTVCVPSSDTIDTLKTIGLDMSLPIVAYTPMPTVYFITNTSAGPAGPVISGTFDRVVTDSVGSLYPSVERQDDLTVVQFGFQDPTDAFSTTAVGQSFYQVTTVNRIAYVQGCLGQQLPK